MKKLLFLLFCTVVMGNGTCLAQNGTGTDSTEVKQEDVIVQPQYPGGIEKMFEFILENFEYPTECKKRNVRGKVEVEFTIEKGGDMSALCILKGLDPDIDREMLRVFRAMPRWTPATKNGELVRYTLVVPVTVKLSRANKKGFR